MPLKNHSPVAAERRMDLASLFCMIGRHGPAVALALIAMVSVLAGFILYRSVRGKRRRAGGAADNSPASPGDERDASPVGTDEEPEPEPELELELEHSPEESTDVSDEGSSFVKEDADPVPGGHKIRHRRAPTEERPPPFCPPPSSTSTTDTLAVQDCYSKADTYTGEASESLPSDSYSVTTKHDTEALHSLPEDTGADAAEESSVERSLTPEQVNHETHTEEDKVLQAKCEEDKDPITAGDVDGELQSVSNSEACFGQDLHTSETVNDYKLQESGNTSNANGKLEESAIKLEEDVSAEDTSQAEENFHCVSESPVSFDPEPLIKENGSDHKQEGNETTPGAKNYSEEQIIEVEEDLSDGKINQEVENLPHAPQSLVCCSPDPHSSVNGEDDQQQDSGTTPDTINLGAPILKIEDVISDDSLNGPVCVEQEFQMSKSSDDHKLQDSGTTDTNGKLEEPVIETEDVCDSNESEIEDKCLPPECTDFSDIEGNKPQSQEKDMKNEEEKREEYSDDQVIVQQSGNSAPELEIDQPSSQQDVCQVTNDLVPSSQDEHNGTSEVTEEVGDEENSNSLTEVKLSINLPQSDEQKVQDEEMKESSLTCGEEDSGFKGIMLSSGTDECQSVAVDSTVSSLNNLAESEKAGDDDVTTDAKVETFDTVSHDQQPGSGVKEDEIAPVLNNDMDPKTLSSDGPSLQEETASEKKETAKVDELVKESFGHLVASCYEDQQFDSTESQETIEEMVNPPTYASVCDVATFTSVVISEEISHPDTLSPHQDMQSDQKQNEDFLMGITGAAADSQIQIPTLSFEQSELTRSLSGFGEESGISSMTVSPDSQDALDEFHITSGNVLPSALDCSAHCEEQAEAQHCVFADDAAVSFNTEEMVVLASEPCSLNLSDQPCQDWALDSSFAVNEDVFGNDIEDAYYSAMEQSLTKIAASTASSTNEVKKEAEIKAPAVVVEIKEKKEDADKKEEEDYERTEISIMEATMDHNEWITDGNYQVLPWMNFSTTSFTQIPTQTDPPHSEEHNPHSAIEDVTRIDPDISTSTEVRESVVEENAENSKKVLAVQPMPQNVNVKFRIHYLTHSPYQRLAITGNSEELGNWKEFILLERDKDGHWSTVISLPAESHVEWKFVVLEKGEVCRWEECGNHLLETGSVDDLIVNKWWGFL